MSSYRDNNLQEIGGDNKAFFNRIIRKLSTFGMDTDSMMMKNSNAVGYNETPTPTGTKDYMYDVFSKNAVAQLFQSKSISLLDRSYTEKVRILREYSIKGEIADYVTMLADEAILYDDDEDFCTPSNLSDEFDKDVMKKYTENFNKIYYRFGFSDGIAAWSAFKKLLIDGYIAYEIIYDDKYKEIKCFKELDPSTLLPGIEPTTGDNIWIQFPESPQFRRILLDSQIIYISYASGSSFSEISYVERLIRPFNQLKLLEQTKIMFNLANAMMYKKFTVPVDGMSPQKAEETVAKLIADYKEEITFNDQFGTVTINGSPHIPYNKEYWFPTGEAGEPSVELISQEGHNLNENDMLIWFFNALKRASRIPFSRFDKDNGGGNVFGDTSEMSRDEETFFFFVQRLRAIFKEIIVKPWRLQMQIDFPELINDENFLRKLDVNFNGSNLYHEWRKLANLQKRAEIAGNLMSQITRPDGTPFLHVELVVRDIIKFDEEFLLENERWWKKRPSGSIGGGTGDTGMGGSVPTMGSGDMGSSDTGITDIASDIPEIPETPPEDEFTF